MLVESSPCLKVLSRQKRTRIDPKRKVKCAEKLRRFYLFGAVHHPKDSATETNCCENLEDQTVNISHSLQAVCFVRAIPA
jgi:hypothetical protein